MVCKLLAVYLYHYVMMLHTFHLCSNKDNYNTHTTDCFILYVWFPALALTEKSTTAEQR